MSDLICSCGGFMKGEGVFDPRVPQQYLFRCVHCGETHIEVRART